MHTELSFKLWILACGLCQIQPPPPPTPLLKPFILSKQAVTGGTGCCKSPCSYTVTSPVAVTFFLAGDCVKIRRPCNVLPEKNGDSYNSEQP